MQNPLTTENMHKIVNAIIAFFLGQIPPNRDPKDFIRSSYRTRDSTEVYLALRLPILRRLLDAETRKVFRDILDSCGGQRQQTRFGSDSTSAQLIPRDLVSKTNLDRIELMIRNRAGKLTTGNLTWILSVADFHRWFQNNEKCFKRPVPLECPLWFILDSVCCPKTCKC